MTGRVSLLLAALAMVGCGSYRISERIWLSPDPEWARNLSPTDPAGVAGLNRWRPLYPGDVLHLVRWTGGAITPAGETTTASFIPQSQSFRVPLRRIAPASHLYDYEREFLYTILTASRNENFGGLAPTAITALTGFILHNEVDIWNAVTLNLAVRREAEPLPGLDHPPPSALAVGLDEHKVFDELHAKPGADNFVQAFLVADPAIASPRINPLGIYCAVPGPQSALFSVPTSVNSSGAHEPNSTRFDFLTVALDGVAIDRPRWPEEQWSLAEWEESGICDFPLPTDPPGAPPTEHGFIELIRVRGGGGTINVVRPGMRGIPNLRVVTSIVPRRRRVIEPVGSSPWFPAIASGDLARLHMEDVVEIHWSRLDGMNTQYVQGEPVNRTSCRFSRPEN